MRESELAASIDHPNIMPIYQAGESDGLLYLVMRYVDGRDLGDLLKTSGALDPYVALPIFTQVAAALDTAHANGLVHRDVKPGNILLSADDGAPETAHVYLTDFGLTKRSASLSGFTTAGHFLGTILYVAPEQISAGPVDERADIYAMGCVLFEGLTGTPPFQRDDDAALLWAHIHDDPPLVSELRPDLPEELDAVLEHAMAKEPGDRPGSCRELVAELRAAFRSAQGRPAGAPGATGMAETGIVGSVTGPGDPPPQDQPAPGAAHAQVAPEQQLTSPRLDAPAPGQAPPAPPPGPFVVPVAHGAASTPPARTAEPGARGRGRRWPLLAGVGLAVLALVALAAGWFWPGSEQFTPFEAEDGSFSLERPVDWEPNPGAAVHGLCFCDAPLIGLFEGASATAWPTVASAPNDDGSAAEGLYTEVTPGDQQFQVSSAEEARVLVEGINDNALQFDDSGTAVVGNGTGFWLEGTMTPGGESSPALSFRYYLVHYDSGSAQMVFFALPDDFEELDPTIEHVVASVRFG
jgi:hypothetical protein